MIFRYAVADKTIYNIMFALCNPSLKLSKFVGSAHAVHLCAS